MICFVFYLDTGKTKMLRKKEKKLQVELLIKNGGENGKIKIKTLFNSRGAINILKINI